MSYRVFDTKNREWVDPNKILISCVKNEPLTCGNAVFGLKKLKKLPENRYVWHQGIGIFDKNAQEIYEGDICKVNVPDSDDVITVEVAYTPERAAYLMFDWDNSICYGFDGGIADHIEIVGNVFDKEYEKLKEVSE